MAPGGHPAPLMHLRVGAKGGLDILHERGNPKADSTKEIL